MPKTSPSGTSEPPNGAPNEWGSNPNVPSGYADPPRQTQMPQDAIGEPCPSLCQEGPCTRYHEIKSLMDVAKPLDGSAGVERFMTTRTCYPHSGVEMDIDRPIVSCNLWEPHSASSVAVGPLRAAFDVRVAEWAAKRAADEAANEAAAIAATDNDVDDDTKYIPSDEPTTEGAAQ